MPTPHGSLHRAVAELTVGAVRSMRAHDQRQAQMGLSEIMQQFQIEFSGEANLTWGFTNPPVTIEFDFPFYYAPGQRDPDFEHPHFWFGVELTSEIDVAVTTYIGTWIIDEENGAVEGCTLYIGACTNDNGVPYAGIIHATFQGFSALGEDEADLGD